jgi:predicted component of viral defense system (DUF524 family)
VSDFDSYNFSKPGRGSFEFEVSGSVKQVYRSSIPENYKWKYDGLDYIPKEENLNQFFFEWQRIYFTYWISTNNDYKSPFELRVNERIIKRSQLKGDIDLISGSLSFEDAVGDTKIEIRDANNKLIFRLATEVFPQKMDYKSDYKVLMADISQILQNLTYDLFKDTYKKSRSKLKGKPTENEWWNILDTLFDSLLISLNVIKRQPKIEIDIHEEVCQIHKIKQSNKKNFSWFFRNQRYSNTFGIGLKVSADRYYTHALTEKKHLTYDTYENRFVVWAIKNILDHLRKIKKLYKGEGIIQSNPLNSKPDYSPVVNRITLYQGRLQGKIHDSPFNEASDFEKQSFFSTTLTRGVGYRDFLQIYLLLLRGLELYNNDIFKIEQKNISLLYEYWCFLKLVQIANEQYGNEICFQDLIKVNINRFNVTLRKGEESKVVFKNNLVQDFTTIYYNREFTKRNKKVFTFNQIPDFTIKIEKNGFEKPFWFLFDAKYRFEDFEQDNGKTNSYNVPQDAIGQLHRYRDAILHTEPVDTTYKRAIKSLGGVILYPYPLTEEKFKDNNYYKSIEDINIGALPFLPSKTKLISDLFFCLMNRSPEEHYERYIEMDRSDYEEHREKWSEFVTIGLMPNNYIEDRRKFIKQTNIYYVPFVKNLHSKLYLSKYILVHNTVSLEASLYEVKDWEFLLANELYTMGVTWPLSNLKYIAFNLQNPVPITLPSSIGSIRGYRYTSKEGLKKYLATGDKNYFYLTNSDAARLYEELKKSQIEFKISWKDNENDPSLVEFACKGKKILSSITYSPLHYNLDREEVHLSSLLDLLLSDVPEDNI